MPRHSALCAAALAATLSSHAGPAAADHWKATIDPPVYYAGAEIVQTLQMMCYAGQQQICNILPQVNQGLSDLYHRSYACKAEGNAVACQQYNAEAQQLLAYQQQFRAQMAAAAGSPGAAGAGAGASLSHQQRMQQIEQWGAQMRANGNANMKALEKSHNSFLNNVIRK